MKKHLLCIILISIISGMLPLHGAQPLKVIIDGIQYRIKDAKEAVVELVVDRSLANLVIPDAIEHQGKQYPVTQIEDACTSNENLVSLTIGDNVRFIDDNSFTSCTNLETVKFGKSVKIIGYAAFQECNVRSLTFPPSIRQILIAAFQNCKNLSSLTLPNSLEVIDKECFKGCTSLASVDIPESVRQIGESAFRNCTSLTSLNLGYSSDASVGDNMFRDCTSLSTINISASVRQLGDNTFYGCTELQSIEIQGNLTDSYCFNVFSDCPNIKSVKFGYGAKSIPAYMFHDCTNLTEVEVPSTMTTISYSAFQGCHNLKSFDFKNIVYIGDYSFSGSSLTTLNFSDKLKSIGCEAFKHCNNIVELILPRSISFIDSFAFANCAGLETVYNYNPIPQNDKYIFHNSYPEYMTLHVPVGCKEIYASKPAWNFGTIIDDLENTTSTTDIESGENAGIDYAEPFEAYNTQGQLVGDSLGELSKGLYIIRQGNKTEKKLVK